MNFAIIVINLRRSPQRLARMQAQLDALGLPFLRLEATDGSELTAEDLSVRYNSVRNHRQHHKPLSPGEIGCYLSHLRAWQLILDRGLDYAVVLEDDVVLDGNFLSALDQLPHLATAWDVIKLGSRSTKPVLASTPLGPFALCHCFKPPISAFAQAISRAGAEKLLRTRLPFGRPVDVDLQRPWETGVEVLALNPYPVGVYTPEGDISDICERGSRRAMRSRRAAFFRQRLGFVFRLWQHNLRSYGLWRTVIGRFAGQTTHNLGSEPDLPPRIPRMLVSFSPAHQIPRSSSTSPL